MLSNKKIRIQTNRTKLETVIPLKTPFVVYIDPSSKCNLKCKFCPTAEKDVIAKTNRWVGKIDFNLYKKIIDDLKEFDTNVKTLKLSGAGEPLLNRSFPEMVAYAKKSNSVNIIETTTNGTLLNPKLSNEIIEAGLDRMVISIYGISDKDYLRSCRAKIRFEKLLENIKYLYENRKNCFIHIKAINEILDEQGKDKFLKEFTPYCDSIDIEHLGEFWAGYDFASIHNLSLPTVGIYGQEKKDRLVCPYLFYSLCVFAPGLVGQCSNEWKQETIIGDARKQSLKEIWNSKELLDIRIRHLKGKRKDNSQCGICKEIEVETLDDIDNFREEILKKIEQYDNN